MGEWDFYWAAGQYGCSTSHVCREGGGDGARSVAAQGGADGLEPADQVEDFAAGVRTAGGLAEVGAAGEWAVGVDEAAAGPGLEHGAGAVGWLRQTGAAGGAEGLDGDKRLRVGQPRGVTGMAELAALGAPDAIALDGPGGEIGIDAADAGDGGIGAVVAGGVGGRHYFNSAVLRDGVRIGIGSIPSKEGVCAKESLGNMDNLKPETVIVNGAGPVGLTMACELARHGVPFRIFDKNAGPAAESRALAIFPRTLEVFSSIGILDDVLAEGQRIDAMSLYNDTKRMARMNFNSIDSPYPYAIALPQSRTERLLQARLEALGGRVERGMEMTGMEQDGGRVRATYRTFDAAVQTIEGGWLLGCDGAHSAVRHLMGMNFQGGQYDEEFLLADVKIDSDLPTDEGSLFFTKAGIMAYFPFKGGRGRVIADQRPGTQHAGQEPTMEEIDEIIRQRCYHRMEVSDPAWKAWFRISHRMVERYGSGRVYLAGDSAHIHSPAGGQGMNTGIQDAFNLGWKLALVVRGLVAPSLLESYEAERMPVARSVVNLTDRMTRVVTAQHPAAQQLRDLLVPLLTGISFLKEAMAERLAEVSIDYRGSAWVENHGLGPVHAGDRAPDAVLYDRVARAECGIFDLLKTPGFVLLVFEGWEALPAAEGILGDLPGAVHRIVRPGQVGEPGTLEDRDCRARTAYGAAEDGLLVLIRPDGYVGYRGGNAAALAAYIERLKGMATV